MFSGTEITITNLPMVTQAISVKTCKLMLKSIQLDYILPVQHTFGTRLFKICARIHAHIRICIDICAVV